MKRGTGVQKLRGVRTIGALAIIAAGALAGCTYYTPPPYSYIPVACPPGTAAPGASAAPAPSGSVTPTPSTSGGRPSGTGAPGTGTSAGGSPPAKGTAGTTTAGQPAAPPSTVTVPPTATASGSCIAVVPNYPYPTYYYDPYYPYGAPYPGYYYGPPAYGSVFVGGHFH